MTFFFLILYFLWNAITGDDQPQQVPVTSGFHPDVIRSKTFTNVIEITDSNIGSVNGEYLLNVPITDTDKTPVVFIQPYIPVELLPAIYPEFSNMVVIIPNWPYYNQMPNTKLPDGIICAEPMASCIVYEFKRENGTVLKDSIVIDGSFPEMKFKKAAKPRSNQILCFYMESYGSVCCPKDPKYERQPSPAAFIESFERKNRVRITGTYQQHRGKEGEAVFYYSLEGLPNKLKLQCILEREAYEDGSNGQKNKRIYTPIIVERIAAMTLM